MRTATDVMTEEIGNRDELEGFIAFTPGGRSTQRPQVTLRKTGGLSLNTAAYEKLGSPSAIELLYHPQRRIIALRAADPGSANACFLRKQSRSASFLVSIAAFARWAEIPLESTQRYTPDVRSSVLLIELNQEPADQTEGARSGRRRERQLAGV